MLVLGGLDTSPNPQIVECGILGLKIMRPGFYCTNLKQKNPTELSGSSFIIIYIAKKWKIEVKHKKTKLLVTHADPSKVEIWISALLP